VLAQRKRHVVEDAQVGEQCAKLEQHAHAPTRKVQRISAHLPDIQTGTRVLGVVQEHLTLLGTVLSANQSQHCGLAATRCTHQSRHLTPWHDERHAVQDDALAISEPDLAELNECRLGCDSHKKQKPGDVRLLDDK
jgi:hypothetical protein